MDEQKQENLQPRTIGEQRVRVEFNPSASGIVQEIKQAAAHLIDLVEAIPSGLDSSQSTPAIRRLKALAQTAFEEGAMWAVKAATEEKPVA